MKTTDAMSVDEALNHADEWIKGQTFYPGAQGWRVVCAVLAAEVRRLRAGDQSYVDTIEDLHDEIGRLRAEIADLKLKLEASDAAFLAVRKELLLMGGGK